MYIKQPRMKILATGEEFDVIGLSWLDGGETLRAFPLRSASQEEIDSKIPNSYVIIKGEGEDTEVNAILI